MLKLLRQRLVLHKAKLHDPAGREAFLKCLTINKLDCLAVGGCTWFVEDTEETDDRNKSSKNDRWWGKVCDTIRKNAFRLQELTVEGLDRGESTK